jgi:putative membrane protein
MSLSWTSWLKWVFWGLCGGVLVGTLAYLAGWYACAGVLTQAVGLLALLFTALHGACTIGWRRLAGFAFTAAWIGYWAEVYSLRWGSLFGCSYRYPPERWHDLVLGMPISVALFWAVFVYGGYSITNSFLVYLGADKPSRARGSTPLLLVPLVLADATLVTAIDVYMDPICTARGSWVWEEAGPFFGVPIGNFVGWFAVSFLAAGTFRLFEYLRPGGRDLLSPGGHLAPVAAYGLLVVMFTTYTLSIGRPQIALTGIFAMGPAIVLNLVCYAARRRAQVGAAT